MRELVGNQIPIDNQPISATFFDEGKWLTDFITPDAIDVQKLHQKLTENIPALEDRIAALHHWVASLKYTRFVQGRLWIDGKVSIQNDLWNLPSITARVGVGNCSNKSFLLTSLIRQELPPNQVHCILGNLYNGKPGGHAWCQVKLSGIDYIIESTRIDVPVFVPAVNAKRYEAVHLFNDQESYVIEGRTALYPYTRCYSDWLSDYLDWAYIKGGSE